MQEEKELTVLQQQKLIKPTPEDAFSEFLVGKTKNNALDFVRIFVSIAGTPANSGSSISPTKL